MLPPFTEWTIAVGSGAARADITTQPMTRETYPNIFALLIFGVEAVDNDARCEIQYE
jgi:hypothetical protein